MNEQLWLKIAAGLWLSQMQYFIVQVVVARSWPKGYSWAQNLISDLGHTANSPLHALMNGSFVVLGLVMAGGAVIFGAANFGAGAGVGFGLLGLGGLGTVVVGLFPENTLRLVHIVGASLPFLLGNVGLLVLGATLREVPRWLQVYAGVSGAVALVALGLLLGGFYLGIGRGNMERVVSYPQNIWMIVFAAWVMLRLRW